MAKLRRFWVPATIGGAQIGETALAEDTSRAATAAAARSLDDLYDAHAADVERLCLRLLGSPQDAAEASHEAFLRARAALRDLDPKRPVRPWLLAIASNHCIDRLRRRQTEQRLFEPGDAEEQPAPGAGSPLRAVLRREARRELLAAIDDLEPRYRVPLVLRYFAELDYAAIAEQLGVSRGQVGTLLFRAKRRLRMRLGEEGRW